jgi:glycine/D-amino acid oxidase-like deaminating enzyme
VTSLARRNHRWVLTTPQGTLTARRVVLCANGANQALHPGLARTVLPLTVYQVATAPLPASMRAAILPGGQALTDSSANVFSIRFDGEGRLITAWPAMGELGAGALNRAINDRLAASLPAWRETPLAYGWRGVAWMNASLLPRITVVDEDLFAVQACNGRGLALNAIIGREVAGMLQAPGAYRPAIPLGRPAPIPGYVLARHMPGLIIAGAGLGRAAARGAARLADLWKKGA